MSHLPPPPPHSGQPAVAPGEQNQKALWSMVLGIAGLFCGFLSLGALVLSRQAQAEIAASNGAQTNTGQAKAGFILGIVGAVLWIAGLAVRLALAG